MVRLVGSWCAGDPGESMGNMTVTSGACTGWPSCQCVCSWPASAAPGSERTLKGASRLFGPHDDKSSESHPGLPRIELLVPGSRECLHRVADVAGRAEMGQGGWAQGMGHWGDVVPKGHSGTATQTGVQRYRSCCLWLSGRLKLID